MTSVVQQPENAQLVLHPNLGSQYTSTEFSNAVKKAGITPSFSRKGCPYDNAGIESFHATLKKEQCQYLGHKKVEFLEHHFVEYGKLAY